MTSTVNLSPFTNLATLTLQDWSEWSDTSFDAYLARTHAALATVSSLHLEELHHEYFRRHQASLGSTLTALTRLRDINALLAQPKFSHLHLIQLNYYLHIHIEDIPSSTSNTSHFPPTNGPALNPRSGSPSGPLDDDPSAVCAFERYAEGLVRSMIVEELKQFCDRGELEIELGVWGERKDEDDGKEENKNEGQGEAEVREDKYEDKYEGGSESEGKSKGNIAH